MNLYLPFVFGKAFRMPEGTSVYAEADGKAIEVKNTPLYDGLENL